LLWAGGGGRALAGGWGRIFVPAAPGAAPQREVCYA